MTAPQPPELTSNERRVRTRPPTRRKGGLIAPPRGVYETPNLGGGQDRPESGNGLVSDLDPHIRRAPHDG